MQSAKLKKEYKYFICLETVKNVSNHMALSILFFISSENVISFSFCKYLEDNTTPQTEHFKH